MTVCAFWEDRFIPKDNLWEICRENEGKRSSKNHQKQTCFCYLLTQQTWEESKLRHTEGPSPNQLAINELPHELLRGPDVVFLDAWFAFFVLFKPLIKQRQHSYPSFTVCSWYFPFFLRKCQSKQTKLISLRQQYFLPQLLHPCTMELVGCFSSALCITDRQQEAHLPCGERHHTQSLLLMNQAGARIL